MQSKQTFYSLPQFHQAGLQYFSELRGIITSPLPEKIKFFKQKKSEGYELFKNSEFHSALEKYHQSLVIFRWIENRNPNWSNRQINDSDLVYRCHPLSDEIKSYLITAYLNIAICSLKLEQWKEAELACDEVLKIDDKSVKALYRKAQAVSSPVTAGPEDYKNSIKYLKQALALDPKNLEVKQRLLEIKQILLESPNFEGAKSIKQNLNPFSTSIQELDKMIPKWEFIVNHMNENDAEITKFQKNLEKMKKYRAQLKSSLDGLGEKEIVKFKSKKFGIDFSDFISFDVIKQARDNGVEVLKSKPLGVREAWMGWFWVLLSFAALMAFVSYNLEKRGIFN